MLTLSCIQEAAFVSVLIFTVIPCHVEGIESPVNTTSGLVIGKSLTFRGKSLLEFRLIPYALPPVGKRRFKPAQPKTRETTPIDGSKDGYIRCPQYPGTAELDFFRIGLVNQSVTQDEDCLYLDVYVPEAANTTNLLSVLFWIHGGGYVLGNGRYASGRVLAFDFDVVVVTINYRLGALGFLNTGDNNAVGDLGLRDQILALQWVKDNIRNFGGDPEKVTISGESAGGSSVAQLLVSPSSEGLFQRAIIQSAGLDNPWACVSNPRSMAMGFAQSMNCSTTTTAALVQCLRTKSTNAILERQRQFDFIPVCSGGVMPFTQNQLATSQVNSNVAKRLAKVSILMGNNAQEGALGISFLAANLMDAQGGMSDANVDNFTVSTLQALHLSQSSIAGLLPVVRFLYTDWKKPEDSIIRTKKAIDLFSDLFFVHSAIKFARLHAKIKVPVEEKGHTYFYLLKHRPSWMAKKSWRYGADHGDDLFFVFGNPLEYPYLNATDEEQVLSKTIMTYWTNFMKTGNPNTPLTTVSSNPLITWPQFELEKEKYLALDVNMDNESVEEKLFAQRIAFWTEYYPAELKRLKAERPKSSPCADTGSGCPDTTASVVFLFSGIITLFLLLLTN